MFLASLWLNGCATLTGERQRPLQYDPTTAAVLSAISVSNPTLSAFKGIGTYHLSGPERNFSGRVAWAVRLPDRLRIAVLDATGKPLTVVATDGLWLYVDARSEDRFNKKRAGSASLKKMIGIDIDAEALIAVLAGGVPLRLHRLARLDSVAAGCRIDLFDQEQQTVQQIWCRNSNSGYTAESFAVYENNNEIRYQVELRGAKRAGGMTFFKTITFKNHENRFRLEVARIWAPAQINDAQFKLEPR
jgi:hypothetical protein